MSKKKNFGHFFVTHRQTHRTFLLYIEIMQERGDPEGERISLDQMREVFRMYEVNFIIIIITMYEVDIIIINMYEVDIIIITIPFEIVIITRLILMKKPHQKLARTPEARII